MVTWRVALSETTLGEDEALAAADVVRGGWLTQGERVGTFEREFASMVGVPHAVAVANCTLALELAFAAVGVGVGTEVIVPALTFVATANAARRLGATVVFADIRSEEDLTLDPEDVARKITPRTRAICPVHYAGFAADVSALKALAAVAIVEDCAHAPGARRDGKACGAAGDIGAFSFFSNKNMTTGEGGMLTTVHDDLAATLRTTRSHGMSTSTLERHRGHAFSYDVTSVGTNARLDEVRAAIGLIQLRKLNAGNLARRAHVQQYRALLGGIAGLDIPFVQRDLADGSHHLFVVLLPVGSSRERVMTALRDHGIQSSIHYPPTHRFSAYASAAARLPVTDRVADRLLTLPLYPTMTSAQVNEVSDALIRALG